jgi:hypothetical protein
VAVKAAREACARGRRAAIVDSADSLSHSFPGDCHCWNGPTSPFERLRLILEDGHRGQHAPEAELPIERFLAGDGVQDDLLVPFESATSFATISLPTPVPWWLGSTATSQRYEQSAPSARARPAPTMRWCSRAKQT